MQHTSIEAPVERSPGMIAFLPALLVTLFTALCGMAALYAPPPTGQMGVVFPPWTSEAGAIRAVTAAGGTLANGSRFSNIIVAYASDPAFSARVRSEGAWFTVSATGLCGDPIIESGGGA
jgi:hypothetical protein